MVLLKVENLKCRLVLQLLPHFLLLQILGKEYLIQLTILRIFLYLLLNLKHQKKFSYFDGQAVTCDDFVEVMSEANNGFDLDQFICAGTSRPARRG